MRFGRVTRSLALLTLCACMMGDGCEPPDAEIQYQFEEDGGDTLGTLLIDGSTYQFLLDESGRIDVITAYEATISLPTKANGAVLMITRSTGMAAVSEEGGITQLTISDEALQEEIGFSISSKDLSSLDLFSTAELDATSCRRNQELLDQFAENGQALKPSVIIYFVLASVDPDEVLPQEERSAISSLVDDYVDPIYSFSLNYDTFMKESGSLCADFELIPECTR